jgi:very-short-patch-repair endonuclease
MAASRQFYARFAATRAEDVLWRLLRGSRFLRAKFRRQVPFDRFVVDFYCHGAKLAVEIDDKQHARFAEYDAARTETIERLEYKSSRSKNSEVLQRP